MDGLPVNVTDLAIFAILVISGLLAFARGFLREVLSVGAWVGAAVATIYGFPLAKPFVLTYIRDELLANVVTGVVIFIVALGLLSTLSHLLSRNVRSSALGALDRSLGLLFGLVRGAVLVCGAWLLYALFVAPQDMPDWITEARSRPLVEAGGRLILDMLPRGAVERGSQAIDDFGQQVEEKAKDEALRQGGFGTAPEPREPATPATPNPAAPAEGSGYKDQERQDMNRLFQGTQ